MRPAELAGTDGCNLLIGKQERGSNLCRRRPRVTTSAPLHLRLAAPCPLAPPDIPGGGKLVYGHRYLQ